MTIYHYLEVPAYIYPTLAGWTQYVNGAPAVGRMVANPASGPGVSPNSDYTTGITNARAAGIKVIGYVHTSYGARTLADVKADIDSWYSFYTIDGIFIDECATAAGTVSYYQSIYSYVQGKDAVRNHVTINPGTIPDQSYTTAADTICIFENSYTAWQSGFASIAATSWLGSYSPTKFYAIVYSIPDEASRQAVVASFVNAGIEWYFITDQSGYVSAPSATFWSNTLTQITQANNAGTAAKLLVYTDSSHTQEVAHTTQTSSTINHSGTLIAGAASLPLSSIAGFPASGMVDIIDPTNGNETLPYYSITGSSLNLGIPTSVNHANGLTVVQWYYALAVGDQTNGIANDGTNATPNGTNNVGAWYLYNAGYQNAQAITLSTQNTAPSTPIGFTDTLVSITSSSAGFAFSTSPGNIAPGGVQQFWVEAAVPANQDPGGTNPQICLIALSYSSL